MKSPLVVYVTVEVTRLILRLRVQDSVEATAQTKRIAAASLPPQWIGIAHPMTQVTGRAPPPTGSTSPRIPSSLRNACSTYPEPVTPLEIVRTGSPTVSSPR